jgi:hypothetical protein
MPTSAPTSALPGPVPPSPVPPSPVLPRPVLNGARAAVTASLLLTLTAAALLLLPDTTCGAGPAALPAALCTPTAP